MALLEEDGWVDVWGTIPRLVVAVDDEAVTAVAAGAGVDVVDVGRLDTVEGREVGAAKDNCDFADVAGKAVDDDDKAFIFHVIAFGWVAS